MHRFIDVLKKIGSSQHSHEALLFNYFRHLMTDKWFMFLL